MYLKRYHPKYPQQTGPMSRDLWPTYCFKRRENHFLDSWILQPLSTKKPHSTTIWHFKLYAYRHPSTSQIVSQGKDQFTQLVPNQAPSAPQWACLITHPQCQKGYNSVWLADGVICWHWTHQQPRRLCTWRQALGIPQDLDPSIS